MTAFKLTTWNVEWLEFTAGVNLGWRAPEEATFIGPAPTAAEAEDRIDGLTAMVTEINPDVLFVCEGVRGTAHMQLFVDTHLPEYDLISHLEDSAHGVRGDQWPWFLMKKQVADQVGPALLDLDTWQAFTAAESAMGHADGKWFVSLPRVIDGEVVANVRDDHRHFRHPQTLTFTWDGARVEVIGVHLKSKFVNRQPRARRPDESFNDYAADAAVAAYLAEAHKARIKLSTEATDVRYYIDHRFAQDAEPLIFVAGDLNDGPGKELLEREYLFHDLIGNLQGEVFFAQRFLNHGLFDAPGPLRWTAQFRDFLDPSRDEHILLDHILFTQGLTGRGVGPLEVRAFGGKVEHEIYERVTSLMPAGVAASDHRPVSVDVDERGAV